MKEVLKKVSIMVKENIKDKTMLIMKDIFSRIKKKVMELSLIQMEINLQENSLGEKNLKAYTLTKMELSMKEESKAIKKMDSVELLYILGKNTMETGRMIFSKVKVG